MTQRGLAFDKRTHLFQELRADLAHLAHHCCGIDKYRVETCCVIGEDPQCNFPFTLRDSLCQRDVQSKGEIARNLFLRARNFWFSGAR